MPGRWWLLLCGSCGLRRILLWLWFCCGRLLLRKLLLSLLVLWLLGWKRLLLEQYFASCPRLLQAVLVGCYPKPKDIGFPSLIGMMSARMLEICRSNRSLLSIGGKAKHLPWCHPRGAKCPCIIGTPVCSPDERCNVLSGGDSQSISVNSIARDMWADLLKGEHCIGNH